MSRGTALTMLYRFRVGHICHSRQLCDRFAHLLSDVKHSGLANVIRLAKRHRWSNRTSQWLPLCALQVVHFGKSPASAPRAGALCLATGISDPDMLLNELMLCFGSCRLPLTQHAAADPTRASTAADAAMTPAHIDNSVSRSIAPTPLIEESISNSARSRPLLRDPRFLAGNTCQMSTKVHLLGASCQCSTAM
jgi:hypothetical protein